MPTVLAHDRAPRFSAEEWQARVDLAAAYRLAAHFDMDDLIYTHFSAAIPDGSGDFLLNPYGLMFEEITASSLIRVSPDGGVIGDSAHEFNIFGFNIHEPFYRLKPGTAAVMHTHTRAGIAVSAMECGLRPLSQMALHFYRNLGTFRYEGNNFDDGEQRRLMAEMGEARALLLRNHGLLTVGKSVTEAFSRLYYLEQCCRIQVDAMAGGPLVEVDHDTALQMSESYRERTMPFSPQEWPALLRLLDRRLPGYAD